MAIDNGGSKDINELCQSIKTKRKEKEVLFEEYVEDAINQSILWEELYVKVALDQLDFENEMQDKLMSIFSYAFSKVRRDG